jgi:regulator of PEP synthase PpsR (kinase-PPPase family)
MRTATRSSAAELGLSELKRIIIISDGTGATAKRLLDAVLAQHQENRAEYSLENVFTGVRDRKRLAAILDAIDGESLVLFSLISRSLDRQCHDTLTRRGVLHLNVLEPMVLTLAKFLGIHPDYRPGLLQVVDDGYYKKVDSIGFTVQHDDGRGRRLDQADVLLIGLSRTCKTPISMYLACNFGLKVANIPIVSDERILERVRSRIAVLPRDAVFALTLNPDVLAKVRQERRVLTERDDRMHEDLQRYCDIRAVREEVRMSYRFFAEAGVEVINVTWRAIEEVAREIRRKLGAATAFDPATREGA